MDLTRLSRKWFRGIMKWYFGIFLISGLLAGCNSSIYPINQNHEGEQGPSENLNPMPSILQDLPSLISTPTQETIKNLPGEKLLPELQTEYKFGDFYIRTGPRFISGQLFGNTPLENVELGDMDNDGDLDIVVHSMENDSMIQIYENLGQGNIRNSGAVLPFERHEENLNFGIQLVDLNNDGFLDIVSADAWAGLNVYLNHGDFRFSHNQHYTFRGFHEIKGVAANDFNGDGYQDIAAGEHNGDNRGDRILLNDGTGFLIDTKQSLSWDITWSLFSIDFNHDTFPDLISINRYGSETMKVYFNNGSGVFNKVIEVPNSYEDSADIICFASGEYTYCIVANGEYSEAAPDALKNEKHNNIIVFDYSGDIVSIEDFGETGPETKGLCVVDFNDDGIQDIIAANWNGLSYVYYGMTDNQTGMIDFRSNEELGQYSASSIACGDIDGNGKLDFVIGIGANVIEEANYMILYQVN
jgi:hypothetical protein